jgi:hypothetical protein
MKKFLSMVVFVACVGSVAFASVHKPAALVKTDHAVIDTIPGDTTQAPALDTTQAPALDTTHQGAQQGNQADTSGGY